jgi:UDP-N-acetylglucosamine 2-epimerase (non-hydrolysing)
MTNAYSAVLAENRPQAVIVVGDVDSTLACTMAAAAHRVPVVHVEAGLRSAEEGMREESNRRVVDRMASRLYTHSREATERLLAEGRSADDIAQVGNVMIDTLLAMSSAATPPDLGEIPDEFGLVTLHRAELLNEPRLLHSIVESLRTISADLPLIFPLHPRTRRRLDALGWVPPRSMICTSPMLYSRFTWLLARARIVITDSGGLQEEAAFLGRPCLTVRPDTERPVTTRTGANRVIGRSPDQLLAAVRETLSEPLPRAPSIPGWDGLAAERTLRDLSDWLRHHQSEGAGAT